MTTIESLEARVAALANALTEMGLRLQHGSDPELKHAMRQWAGAWAVRWSRVLRDPPAPPAREPEPPAENRPPEGEPGHTVDQAVERRTQTPTAQAKAAESLTISAASGPSPSARERAERLMRTRFKHEWGTFNANEFLAAIASEIDAHAAERDATWSGRMEQMGDDWRKVADGYERRGDAAQAEAGAFRARLDQIAKLVSMDSHSAGAVE